tara:strand:- start:1016 stop:1168 length:153 start_codon:yes stop_codon:yes gene_type:complete
LKLSNDETKTIIVALRKHKGDFVNAAEEYILTSRLLEKFMQKYEEENKAS